MSAIALHTYFASRSKLLGRITNRNCSSVTTPPLLGKVGAIELHKIGSWHSYSVHGHCLLSTMGCGWYCYHNGMSFLKVRHPLLCSLLTHNFLLFVFTPHAHFLLWCFLISCGRLVHWSGIAPKLLRRMRGTLS